MSHIRLSSHFICVHTPQRRSTLRSLPVCRYCFNAACFASSLSAKTTGSNFAVISCDMVGFMYSLPGCLNFRSVLRVAVKICTSFLHRVATSVGNNYYIRIIFVMKQSYWFPGDGCNNRNRYIPHITEYHCYEIVAIDIFVKDVIAIRFIRFAAP